MSAQNKYRCIVKQVGEPPAVLSPSHGVRKLTLGHGKKIKDGLRTPNTRSSMSKDLYVKSLIV